MDKVIGADAAKALWESTRQLTASIRPINPNILDNWYFVDPVNRNGKALYTGTSDPCYTIDRWWIQNNSQLYVNSDGVRINSVNHDRCMYQIIRGPLSRYLNQTLTFSLLHSLGCEELTFVVNGDRYEASTSFGGKVNILSEDSYFKVSIYEGPSAIVFKAAKLEIGASQTLARQIESGWILNEIPKYSDQYAICKMYDRGTGEFTQWSFIGD